MEGADLESHKTRFNYIFKNMTMINENCIIVELGPVKGALGLILSEKWSCPIIMGVKDWSEFNKLNVNNCELRGAEVVAADIGEGGTGDFIHISMLTRGEFLLKLRQQEECGNRGVTLRIKVSMPKPAKRFVASLRMNTLLKRLEAKTGVTA